MIELFGLLYCRVPRNSRSKPFLLDPVGRCMADAFKEICTVLCQLSLATRSSMMATSECRRGCVVLLCMLRGDMQKHQISTVGSRRLTTSSKSWWQHVCCLFLSWALSASPCHRFLFLLENHYFLSRDGHCASFRDTFQYSNVVDLGIEY